VTCLTHLGRFQCDSRALWLAWTALALIPAFSCGKPFPISVEKFIFLFLVSLPRRPANLRSKCLHWKGKADHASLSTLDHIYAILLDPNRHSLLRSSSQPAHFAAFSLLAPSSITACGMSATSSSPLRSALPHHASSSNAALSTVKALREGDADSVRTSDAPALPFVVTRHFISNSERYQLFPGAFPDVEEDLGRGASFVVQCARLPDRTNVSSGKNISVALKRIRPGRNSSRTRQSFQEIIADLICLSHQPLHQHPNVVTLLGLGWELSPSTSDSRLWPYLILEYAVHGTLADFQNSGKILPYAEKKKIALDIADGLGAVHYSNIIHGDIKSENILLFEDPEEGLIAKLSDFGYATLNIDFSGSQSSINDEPEEVLVKSGTIPWTAPEYGKVVPWEHAFKSDVYSWGLLVWRIFIDGANPFRAHQQLFEELGGNRDHLETPNVLQWKSADVVQAAAKKFASTVRQPAGEYRLEKVFEWSLKLKPQERDLLRASLSWRFGPQYVKSHSHCRIAGLQDQGG
jgi:hypothetical protein